MTVRLDMHQQFAGKAAGRALIGLAMADGDPYQASEWVRHTKWLDTSELSEYFVSKAAVSSISSTNVASLEPSAVQNDFIDVARDVSLLQRLDARPGVPKTRVYTTDPVVAGRLTEGVGLPMRFTAVDTAVLQPIGHGAALIVTNDLLKQAARAGVAVDRYLARVLAVAAFEAEDQSFLDPTYAGSILAGLTPVASTGTTASAIDTDLQNLIDQFIAFGGNLASAVLVASPLAAVHMSLLRSSGPQAYAGVTANGGTLAGLPLLVSRGAITAGTSPEESCIAILDRSKITVWRGVSELDASKEASIQMDDAPTQRSVTSVTATSVVSLFQTNSTALKATVWSAWSGAPGAAQYIADF